MKLTEIRFDRTKSLGNYENLKLGCTAVLEDGESASEAITRLEMLIDWHVNASERNVKYKKLKSQDTELTESELAWIAIYEARKAEAEAF